MAENIKRGNDIDMLFRSAVNMLAEEQGQADLEMMQFQTPSDIAVKKLQKKLRSAKKKRDSKRGSVNDSADGKFRNWKRSFVTIAACAAALLIFFSMIGSLSFNSGSSDMASDGEYRYLLEYQDSTQSGIRDSAQESVRDSASGSVRDSEAGVPEDVGTAAVDSSAVEKENEDSISQNDISENQTGDKNMNKNIKIVLAMAIAIILICCLAACTQPGCTSERIDPKAGADCGHKLFEGDNIVPHDAVGYCGNIQMTVKYAPMGAENDTWEKTISGSPAVKLTDMFMWFDYSEPTCDCAPEYTVISEGGEVYGLSLTEGYARHGDAQVSLTDAQVADLKETMTSIAEYEGDMLMYRQVEE